MVHTIDRSNRVGGGGGACGFSQKARKRRIEIVLDAHAYYCYNEYYCYLYIVIVALSSHRFEINIIKNAL